MKSPTSDQYYYLLEKSIFKKKFNDIYQNMWLIVENIMNLVGEYFYKWNFIVIAIY